MKKLSTYAWAVALAVFFTATAWTVVFLVTGDRLDENLTTLVALAAIGVGYYCAKALKRRTPRTPPPRDEPETGSKPDSR
jgi:hypothetical protein